MPRRYRRILLTCLLVTAALGLGVQDSAARGSHRNDTPVRRSLPRISGSPVVGNTLRASRGRWRRAQRFTYQWKRCNARGARCQLIRRPRRRRGARPQPANVYRLVGADIGHEIRVTVVARNRHGSTSATSRPTRVVRRRASVTPTPVPPAPAPAPGPTSGPGVHVLGNHLVNANGQAIALHGVDQSGTEYECSEGYGIFDNGTASASASETAQEATDLAVMSLWHINSVFIGLNEDCWLGINGINSAYSGQNYINDIKSAVLSAERVGIYPVIGFYWGDPGNEVPSGSDGNGGGQPAMPDNDHTPLFWEEVAQTFRSDPNVIFRLQEEPHPDSNNTTLAAWQCWSQGDVQYATSSDSAAFGTAPRPVSTATHCNETSTNGSAHYATVGMQSLINIIRGTGASNVIQVPGLAYANMAACSPTGNPAACGMLDSADGVKVSDPLASPQLMADFDMYPDAGQVCDTTACYNATLAPVAAAMPVDLGEIGAQNNVDTQANVLLNWMDARQQSYYAWAWDSWAELISNDAKGTPDSPWGTDYRSRIVALP